MTAGTERKVRPIFLMGVPKSGTTLLQRILASHSKISSASEPWFLLPAVYAFRESGIFTEYGARSCQLSMQELFSELPRGRLDYLKACSRMAQSIYEDLADRDSVFFLDKTPRYHLIIDQLVELFPDAKFIFIWRNPLSLMASTIEHNDGNIRGLRFSQIDFLRGLPNLVKYAQKHKNSIHELSYEDLVLDPQNELKKIMHYLGLEFEETQLYDFTERIYQRGDKNGQAYTSIQTDSIEKWRTILATPARKLLAGRLLRNISPEVLHYQGYSRVQLEDKLKSLITDKSPSILLEFIELLVADFYSLIQGTVIQKSFKKDLLY